MVVFKGGTMDINEEYAELKLAKLMAQNLVPSVDSARVIQCIDNVLESMREGHGLDADDDEGDTED